MKYSVNKRKENNEFLFFWGHTPSKNGKVSKSCFSQWWEGAFVVEEKEYKTAEHWMMAKKAELFKDDETLQKVLNSKTPVDAKKAGREVKGYIEEIWMKNRFQIVKEGNLHKFSQNQELKMFLLNTENKVLVEASPYDPIWGIGMAVSHTEINKPEKWLGLNLLGFALMEVRDELLL
jgi:ribA/ribD-fused uncharacterized protein